MENNTVVFLDSGIGSIPYAGLFHSRNKTERLIMIADRENFPYGPKSKEELCSLLLSLCNLIVNKFQPKLLVIACNTATISAIAEIRKAFPSLPIVGTVPAVKPAALGSKKRCIAVLGTRRTVEEPYITELISEFGPDCTLIKKAAPDLVEFVEHEWLDADAKKRLETAKFWTDMLVKEGADAIVLSCTHFLLLQKEFITAAKDRAIIYDSLLGVVKRAEALLQIENVQLGFERRSETSSERNGEVRPIMIVTGREKPALNWERICEHFNFGLGENLVIS